MQFFIGDIISVVLQNKVFLVQVECVLYCCHVGYIDCTLSLQFLLQLCECKCVIQLLVVYDANIQSVSNNLDI